MHVAKLSELLNEYADALEMYDWPSETDRWMELLVCLCHQSYTDLPIQSLRGALCMLKGLDLITPAQLERVGPGSEEYSVIRHILRKHGLPESEASRVLNILINVSRATSANYAGKIQKVLRPHAIAAREELVTALKDSGLEEDSLRFALTHWLQNTTNAPITLETESVLTFCRDYSIDVAALYAAADELNVNVAVLDDVLDLNAGTTSKVRPDAS